METRVSLIQRLKNADDVAAWDEFVELYGPVIFRAARARGFQNADADNVVQEVLLAVAQSVSRWLERDDRGSFRRWLLSLARNHAVDLLTQRATRPIGQDGAAAEQVMNELQVSDAISSMIDLEYERAVFQWSATRVREIVASHTWQAFWLTHVEGYPIDVAAKKLNTRPGNIYFGRSRVMARIQELVRQFEEETE